MSISAAATTPPWSWPTGMDPSSSANGAQTATSAFQASLMQWQANAAAGTPGTTTNSTAPSTETQPDQPSTAGARHHHHHHETDGSQQSGGSSIQSTLSSLVGDIANALGTNGSGTGSTGISGGSNTSLQSVANTLVAEIGQATQANASAAGTTTASAAGTTAVSAAGTTAASAAGSDTPAAIQLEASTLATDIAQAMQAYGVSQAATSGNVLVSL